MLRHLVKPGDDAGPEGDSRCDPPKVSDHRRCARVALPRRVAVLGSGRRSAVAAEGDSRQLDGVDRDTRVDSAQVHGALAIVDERLARDRTGLATRVALCGHLAVLLPTDLV